MASKLRAIIRNDKNGKFIMINGKKFGIGKQVPKDILENFIRSQVEPVFGSGAFDDKGMSNLEIDEVMKKYPEYLGCISHDELPLIIKKVKPQSRGGCVVNTDGSNLPGQHWQALYWDARPGGDSEIDFFDSFADPIDPKLMIQIKHLADKLNARTYLKFKENHIILQNEKTSNCGWFACSFLIDRFRGKDWKSASKYDDSKHGEDNIEKMKSHYGYLKSFGDGDV